MTDYDNLPEFELGIVRAFENIATQIKYLGVGNAHNTHGGHRGPLHGNQEWIGAYCRRPQIDSLSYQ